MNDVRIFTDKEASEFLRISQVSLWRLRRAGQITYRRVSNKVMYLREDLDDYLERTKRGAFGKGVRNELTR